MFVGERLQFFANNTRNPFDELASSRRVIPHHNGWDF
jgi:hypothetical protein